MPSNIHVIEAFNDSDVTRDSRLDRPFARDCICGMVCMQQEDF